jgi:6-pyruvoyltetrahydropterin/6-carboxytetrahydropterin synthase
MIINITDVKSKINSFLMSKYDHHYLNTDTKPFDTIQPTCENIAGQLLSEAIKKFDNSNVKTVSCHLVESENKEATSYANNDIESHYWLNFSAARVTRSPNLSDEENIKLFGKAAAPSGHGHNYKLRITLQDKLKSDYGLIEQEAIVQSLLVKLFEKFDHKNLNLDVQEFKTIPTTTEMLARVIYNMTKEILPVARVKLYENDNFFIEYDGTEDIKMSVASYFNAAHRLHSERLSDSENLEIYDKCNNLMGHGHRYKLETTISNKLDDVSGTAGNLVEMIEKVNKITEEWDYMHLDKEVDDFKETVATGENMIRILWKKLENQFEESLYRIRLWETSNNRFTLRRKI